MTVVREQIQEWRRKSLEGTITLEECRAAVEAIRKERAQASEVSNASRARKAKAKEPAADGQALLSGLLD